MRENGFYWVKVMGRNWSIGGYDADTQWWHVAGEDGVVDDWQITTIGDKIDIPEKYR